MLDILVVPSVANDVALGHLPEQVGAAAGRVLFLASDAEAGAHYAAVVLAALSYANATQRGPGQTAMAIDLILGKLKMSFRFPGMIVGAESQIFVEAIGFDHFAGIHLPRGIPDRFELAKSLNKFGAKHFRKELGARLAVATLVPASPL